MRKEPIMLTRAVPYGKTAPPCALAHAEITYRNAAPMPPPQAMNNSFSAIRSSSFYLNAIRNMIMPTLSIQKGETFFPFDRGIIHTI